MSTSLRQVLEILGYKEQDQQVGLMKLAAYYGCFDDSHIDILIPYESAEQLLDKSFDSLEAGVNWWCDVLRKNWLLENFEKESVFKPRDLIVNLERQLNRSDEQKQCLTIFKLLHLTDGLSANEVSLSAMTNVLANIFAAKSKIILEELSKLTAEKKEYISKIGAEINKHQPKFDLSSSEKKEIRQLKRYFEDREEYDYLLMAQFRAMPESSNADTESIAAYWKAENNATCFERTYLDKEKISLMLAIQNKYGITNLSKLLLRYFFMFAEEAGNLVTEIKRLATDRFASLENYRNFKQNPQNPEDELKLAAHEISLKRIEEKKLSAYSLEFYLNAFIESREALRRDGELILYDSPEAEYEAWLDDCKASSNRLAYPGLINAIDEITNNKNYQLIEKAILQTSIQFNLVEGLNRIIELYESGILSDVYGYPIKKLSDRINFTSEKNFFFDAQEKITLSEKEINAIYTIVEPLHIALAYINGKKYKNSIYKWQPKRILNTFNDIENFQTKEKIKTLYEAYDWLTLSPASAKNSKNKTRTLVVLHEVEQKISENTHSYAKLRFNY